MPRHNHKTKDERTDIDIEATDFACELLLPEKEFKQAIKDGDNTIMKLARKFEVPSLAVRTRLLMLGIIKRFD